MQGSDFGLSNTSRHMEHVVQSVATDVGDVAMVMHQQRYLQMYAHACKMQILVTAKQFINWLILYATTLSLNIIIGWS